MQRSPKASSQFTPAADWTLLSQGAEARIWKIPDFQGQTVVAKERFSKIYRHPILDEKLTKQRCRAEARILEKCLEKGKLSVPKVVRVEAPVLYLEFLGEDIITLRERLEEILYVENGTSESLVLTLASSLGSVLAKMNNVGVVHGDLTSSNMMVHRQAPVSSETVSLIDFGLAKNSNSAEERAVDLYVLERALISTHPKLPESFLKAVIDVYGREADQAEATLTRLEQVRQRGRKRECFG
jgi:TP53 regulating kinase-like protein